MRLALNDLPIGSKTADDRLLEQLGDLSARLDEESDELLKAFSTEEDSEAEPDEADPDESNFGVVYVRDIDADHAVGYLRYHCSGKIYRIDGLYVLPEYRRKCIGYLMMRRFYEVCRREKAIKINLGCIASNRLALAFYKNEGYKISDTTYLLTACGKTLKKSSLNVEERDFTKDEFESIWKAMSSFLDRQTNLPEEIEFLRFYYAESKSLKPFSICSIDGFDYAFFVCQKDHELYLVASTVHPDALGDDLLNDLAAALLQYAKKRKLKAVCVADIHFPLGLGARSEMWTEVGHTLYRMASDLHPQPSNLKI